MIGVRRVLALLVGALLFCYPGYVIISEWLGVRTRFPQNASSFRSVVLTVSLLYGAILGGVALRSGERRLQGREAFRAGARGAGVLFVLGFFGPFVYAWVTRTEVGNIAPIVGVLGLIAGTVIAIGVGLIAFGLQPDNGRTRPE